MKKKVIVLMFSMFFIALVINSQVEESDEIVKKGNVEVYVGSFDLQSVSLDHYVRISNAVVSLLNTETLIMVHSGVTDQNGYLHLDQVVPGKYFIKIQGERGEYFHQDGVLIVKAVEHSKVYLHLQQESDLDSIRGDLNEVRISSFFTNLTGKVLEVSNSPHISSKNPQENERRRINRLNTPKKKKDKLI